MKDAVATPEDLLGQANEALGNADWAAARRLFAEALAPDQRQLAQPLGLFTPTRTQQGPPFMRGFLSAKARAVHRAAADDDPAGRRLSGPTSRRAFQGALALQRDE